MDRAEPVIRLDSVRVTRDEVAILDDVCWEVRTGERWVVLGPNGSGKTTLLRVAGMRLLPTRGTAEVLGEAYGRSDVRDVRRRIGFVSGSLLRAFRPTVTATEVVLSGREAALETWWHRYDEDDHVRAAALLAEAGLGAAAERPFEVLSEGERQRVLLARSLMARPELLLFDEPAAGLDVGARERLVSMLDRLAADPATPPMVLVTHHTEEIPAGATHAALMRRGSMVASGPVAEVVESAALSDCFETDLVVDRRHGRWSTRAPRATGPG